MGYAIHIRGNRVRVSRYEAESDMSEETERIFAKFKRDAVNDYRIQMRDRGEMNHVEAQILDLVARLHPHSSRGSKRIGPANDRYLDEPIGRFDREVQFYLAYLEYIAPLKAKGLAFSLPHVSARSKDVGVTGHVRSRRWRRS